MYHLQIVRALCITDKAVCEQYRLTKDKNYNAWSRWIFTLSTFIIRYVLQNLFVSPSPKQIKRGIIFNESCKSTNSYRNSQFFVKITGNDASHHFYRIFTHIVRIKEGIQICSLIRDIRVLIQWIPFSPIGSYKYEARIFPERYPSALEDDARWMIYKRYCRAIRKLFNSSWDLMDLPSGTAERCTIVIWN